MSHEADHVHTEQEMYYMERDNWLLFGIQAGWVGPPLCHDHDTKPPVFESGGCEVYIRMYKSQQEKEFVESNHQPSDFATNHPEAPIAEW